jgi:predicted ATP-dependent endonuclease of OLD family
LRLTEVKVAGFRTFASEITLVVDPTVTVLLGANDHGKSNLLSAVGHLNDDAVFKDEDLSWDLSGSSTSFPDVSWTFTLTDDERDSLLRSPG